MRRCVTVFAVALAVCAAFGMAGTVRAQVSVQVRDTTVFRGASFDYPLRVSLPDSIAQRFPTFDSARIVVRFTPDVLTLNAARGGGDALLQCDPLQVDSSFQSKSVGTLVIRCAQLRRPTSTMNASTLALCTLNFGTLVGRDSTARVSVDSLFINGQRLPLAGKQAGAIIVRDTLRIVETFTELLDQNAPNPCSGFTVFKYTVREPTDVAFTIFALDGQAILELPTVRRTRGLYEQRFTFDNSWATGAYYLRMKTASGASWRRFMIFR